MTRSAPLLRWAIVCMIVATVALWTLLVSGCATVSPRIDPPVHFAETSMIAWYSAEQDANAQGGDVYYVQNTHSMEPTLWGGDYLVVVPGEFKSWQVGQILTYDAEWMPAGEPNVTHRIVAKDRDGLLMAGDNSPAESRYRVTDKNDVGIVTGIWRVRT